MSEALAAVSAAPPANSSKGLMEQENAAAEPNGEKAFANLVEALLPAATPLDPGAELPAMDVPLPGEIAADPALLGGVALSAVPPFAARVPPPTPFNGGGASSGLAPLRAATSRAAAGASAQANVEQRMGEYDPTSSVATDFADAWRDFGSFEREPDALQALAAAAPQGSTATATALDLSAPGLHGLSAASERTAAPEPPKLVLDSRLPVLHPAFADRFSEQVTVLVEHGVRHAQLSLNPSDLGPIEVRISFHSDEATIQFASHHPAARDAMAEAMPRLREMLDGAGVRLGESGVFAQLPQREQPSGQPPSTPRELPLAPWLEADEPLARPDLRVLRLVDAYA